MALQSTSPAQQLGPSLCTRLQVVEATVQAQPSAQTGGRMLLHVPLSMAAAAGRAAGAKESGPPGTLSATVTGVHELHLDLQVGGGAGGSCC